MRTMIFGAILLLLFAAGSPAFYGSKEAGPQKALTGQWYLQPGLPSDTATGQYPSLNFNQKKKTFTGNTGCNSISGSFEFTDSSFHFNENLRIGENVCTGYNEAAFLKSLLMTNRYTLEDTVLIFWYNQTELSRWTRRMQKGIPVKRT